jgi:hypothetical protein
MGKIPLLNTNDSSAAVGLHKSVVPFKQHFHSGELFLRLRLSDNVEDESKNQ